MGYFGGWRRVSPTFRQLPCDAHYRGHSRSSSPMADYYQLLVRALTGLGKNPDEAWRAAFYARARGALVIELCGVTPPLSDAEITSECLLFEEAIRKVEADLTHRPLSAAGVSTPLLRAGPAAEVRPGWVTNAGAGVFRRSIHAYAERSAFR